MSPASSDVDFADVICRDLVYEWRGECGRCGVSVYGPSREQVESQLAAHHEDGCFPWR